jgi:hypothetical protein
MFFSNVATLEATLVLLGCVYLLLDWTTLSFEW